LGAFVTTPAKRYLGTTLVAALLTIMCSTTAFADDGTQTPSTDVIRAEQEADAAQISEIRAKLASMTSSGRALATKDVKSGAGAAGSVMAYSSVYSGTYGDFWVSLVARSGSVGFAGHAAIVSTNSKNTVESFAKDFSPIKKDGVQKYPNDWGSRANVLMLRPKGATTAKYAAAAKYAEKQVGDPYNWNFANKMTESEFYCSQLVWRAWLNQNTDIEKGSIPNVAVTPADLVNSSNTYIVINQ
jgi:uncharacterized protein YycO